MEERVFAGIDIGGSATKAGIVGSDGKVLIRGSLPTEAYDSADSFINDLTGLITDMAQKASVSERLSGIGIGAPNGNYLNGTIDTAHNIKWCDGVIPFAEMLSARIGLPVVLTNDANAAAMGEMKYGAARGMQDFIVLTLGTGVGSGIVVNGQIVYGSDGLAGELGHTKIVRKGGRLCGCGGKGCLEAYCSAAGIAHTARETVSKGKQDTMLYTVAPGNMDAVAVYNAAVKGDRTARQILAGTGRMLGEAAAGFVLFSSPEAIILFGGLSRAGEFIRKPMEKAMNDNLMPRWKGKVRILVSTLPESDAAVLGAAALAEASGS